MGMTLTVSRDLWFLEINTSLTPEGEKTEYLYKPRKPEILCTLQEGRIPQAMVQVSL